MATPETQNSDRPQHPPSGPAPHEERPPDQRHTDLKDAGENARDAVDAGETEPLPEERHREPPKPSPASEERDDPPTNDPAVEAPPDPDQPNSERTN